MKEKEDIQYFYFRSQDCDNTFIDYDVFVVVLRRQEYTINTTNAFTYSTEFTTVHSWTIIFFTNYGAVLYFLFF